MAESRRLTLAQVRAVHRLVGECRELGDEPRRWRPHLLAGANALLEIEPDVETLQAGSRVPALLTGDLLS